MYFQPIDKPQALKFRSPEHVRVFEQHLRNVQRLIQYQNLRYARGLAPVSYPEALLVIPTTYSRPIGQGNEHA